MFLWEKNMALESLKYRPEKSVLTYFVQSGGRGGLPFETIDFTYPGGAEPP